MVTIVKQVKLEFQGRSWVVPPGFLFQEDGEEFVRLRPSCHGLCILLGCDKKIRNPSLKGSTALKQLVDGRNCKLGLIESKDEKPKLFGDDERASPKKKRKVQAVETKKLDLDLPDGSGIVTVKAVKWTREDLSVVLEAEQLERLFNLIMKDELSFDVQSRAYRRTGKHVKAAKKETDDSSCQSD
ncbi:unnamed protein product [Symbiodinium sp. CCMP2592]|nr:unnamed protein product [Symbiodinium sp. CCMP2592]